MQDIGWRAAMSTALYGPAGFFVGPGGPGGHFRTSVHASPLFAGAVARLIVRVDQLLGRPPVFDLVDVGAGRGELLAALRSLLPAELVARVRMVAVELAPRPPDLADGIVWRPDVPDRIVGLLLATEWLDNVPLDVAETDGQGRLRTVLVDPAGTESPGPPVSPADRLWLARWWPAGHGRVEIGWTRDLAWADAVDRVWRGCALAVDYGHVRAARPTFGTLTGFRDGRQVEPVPDGSTDVTAHVAMDAAAAAAGADFELVTQRVALRALGVDGRRPPIGRASTDPAGYLRALGDAGAAAELTDPDGLGGHWWLLHTVGVGNRGSMVA